MQGLKGVIIVATIVAATVALGGCFGHHEKAVVAEPLKLELRRGRAGCSRLSCDRGNCGSFVFRSQDMDAGTP